MLLYRMDIALICVLPYTVLRLDYKCFFFTTMMNTHEMCLKSIHEVSESHILSLLLLFQYLSNFIRHATSLSHSRAAVVLPTACFSRYAPSGQAARTVQLPTIGTAANSLLVHVPRLPQKLRRGEGVGGGTVGRMSWLRRCVAALVDEERIELPWPVALETRQYAERLIQEAVRTELLTSDLSKLETIEDLVQPPWNEYPELVALTELSVFWLQQPQLVAKLLKVIFMVGV